LRVNVVLMLLMSVLVLSLALFEAVQHCAATAARVWVVRL